MKTLVVIIIGLLIGWNIGPLVSNIPRITYILAYTDGYQAALTQKLMEK